MSTALAVGYRGVLAADTIPAICNTSDVQLTVVAVTATNATFTRIGSGPNWRTGTSSVLFRCQDPGDVTALGSITHGSFFMSVDIPNTNVVISCCATNTNGIQYRDNGGLHTFNTSGGELLIPVSDTTVKTNLSSTQSVTYHPSGSNHRILFTYDATVTTLTDANTTIVYLRGATVSSNQNGDNLNTSERLRYVLDTTDPILVGGVLTINGQSFVTPTIGSTVSVGKNAFSLTRIYDTDLTAVNGRWPDNAQTTDSFVVPTYSTNSTPELDSILLFGTGVFGLYGYGRTRLRSRRRAS